MHGKEEAGWLRMPQLMLPEVDTQQTATQFTLYPGSQTLQCSATYQELDFKSA